MRKFRARPSFTMASPAPAISIPRDKAACSAFLSAVREEYTRFTGILTINPDGSLFCDSLRTDRTLDLRDRTYFKQALVAQGAVTLEPVFGRLTGISVLQIAYPVRAESGELKFILLASFNLKKFADVSRQAPVERQRDSARRQERHGPGCAREQGLDRAGRRNDRELGAVPLCGLGRTAPSAK